MGGFRAVGPIWSCSPNNRSPLRWLIFVESTVWVGLELTMEPKTAASLCSISLLHCCCLFNWNINGCVFHQAGKSCVLCEVKWISGLRAIYLPIAIIISRRRITSRLVFLFFCVNTHFLPNFSPLWYLCGCSLPHLHLLSLYTFLHLTLPSLSPPSSPYFSDGMCSCCCLLFPIAVFASQHGDFGIAAELRCHGSGLCCRTVYTWDLESLSVLSLSPIYSTFLSGFLWCSRGYQHPSLSPHSSITLKSTLTYIMRHIYLKTKFMSIPYRLCLYHYLPLSTSSFHFLYSCLYFVPSPFPCGGSNTALRDTTVPRVPWHTSLSPVYFETQQRFSLDCASNSHRLI